MKKLRKRCLVTLGTAMSLVMFFSLSAMAAMTDKEVIEVLQKFSFEGQNIFATGLKYLGWMLCKGLAWLVDGMQYTVMSVNDVMGKFFSSDKVMDLSNKVLPLGVALIAVVILYVGITMIIKPQQGTTIVGNFIVGVVVTLALPFFLTQAYSLTDGAIEYLFGKEGEVSMGNKILAENIIDNTMYDGIDFSSTELKDKNYVYIQGGKYSGILDIDPCEVVKPDKMENQDVWKKRVVIDSSGTPKLEDLWNGEVMMMKMDILSQYYYRWDIDFLVILVTLIVTAIAFILSSIRIARLLFELAFHQSLTQIMGLVDFYNGQRLKKCLQTIVATFATLFACFFILQLYLVATTYVSTAVDNIFVKIVLLFALAWAVIDGPDLFQQIFGIDAGIKSGAAAINTAWRAGQITGRGAKLTGKAVGGASKAVGGVTKTAVMGKKGVDGKRHGGIKGAAESVKDKIQAARSNADGGGNSEKGASSAQATSNNGINKVAGKSDNATAQNNASLDTVARGTSGRHSYMTGLAGMLTKRKSKDSVNDNSKLKGRGFSENLFEKAAEKTLPIAPSGEVTNTHSPKEMSKAAEQDGADIGSAPLEESVSNNIGAMGSGWGASCGRKLPENRKPLYSRRGNAAASTKNLQTGNAYSGASKAPVLPTAPLVPEQSDIQGVGAVYPSAATAAPSPTENSTRSVGLKRTVSTNQNQSAQGVGASMPTPKSYNTTSSSTSVISESTAPTTMQYKPVSASRETVTHIEEIHVISAQDSSISRDGSETGQEVVNKKKITRRITGRTDKKK